MRDSTGQNAKTLQFLCMEDVPLHLFALVSEPMPFGRRKCDGDLISSRAGERHLVGRPCAGTADVLVAHDTDDLPLFANRRVEHRRDAERHEVAVAELTCSWIFARVVRIDTAPGFERGEVSGIVLCAQHLPATQRSSGEQVIAHAAQFLPVVAQNPDADAFDV